MMVPGFPPSVALLLNYRQNIRTKASSADNIIQTYKNDCGMWDLVPISLIMKDVFTDARSNET